MTPRERRRGGPLDDAGAVREEDAFDLDAVRRWLADRGAALDAAVEVRQFGGGASNLTFSLRDATHDLVLRKPPSGQKAKGAHDMGRESRVQQGLAEVFPLVPAMVAHCDDESVIGTEFYVMERVDGVIPRRDFPPDVAVARADPRALPPRPRRAGRLHAVDVAATPLAAMDRGDGYVARQVGGWSRRLRDALTDDVGRVGEAGEG